MSRLFEEQFPPLEAQHGLEANGLNTARSVVNLRCYLLSLLRIHRPDCELCNAREKYGVEMQKRLESGAISGCAGADGRPAGVLPIKIVSQCREPARRMYYGAVFEIKKEIRAERGCHGKA